MSDGAGDRLNGGFDQITSCRSSQSWQKRAVACKVEEVAGPVSSRRLCSCALAASVVPLDNRKEDGLLFR